MKRKEVGHFGWDRSPDALLLDYVEAAFRGMGYSVLRLEVPHVLVAKDGVTAILCLKMNGNWTRVNGPRVQSFAEQWQGHIFDIATPFDAAYAANRMMLQAATLNRARPSRLLRGIPRVS